MAHNWITIGEGIFRSNPLLDKYGIHIEKLHFLTNDFGGFGNRFKLIRNGNNFLELFIDDEDYLSTFEHRDKFQCTTTEDIENSKKCSININVILNNNTILEPSFIVGYIEIIGKSFARDNLITLEKEILLPSKPILGAQEKVAMFAKKAYSNEEEWRFMDCLKENR